MSLIGADASAAGLVVPATQESRFDKTFWRAVEVTESWVWNQEGALSGLPDRVKDTPTAIHLMPGEHGISLETKPHPNSGTTLHRVCFYRYGVPFAGK